MSCHMFLEHEGYKVGEHDSCGNVEQDEENEGAYRPRTAQAVQL